MYKLNKIQSELEWDDFEKSEFFAHKLEKEWGLLGTGPVGPYKHRIIAPIHFRNELVSYQGRDITGKSPLRYKACSEKNEVMKHKHTLYGIDKVPGKRVVVVEGIADVWRLGPGAVATFGIKFTGSQINLLSEFEKVFIIFDSGETEDQAEEQSEILCDSLGCLGVDTEQIRLDGVDPGDMGQTEANNLMKSLNVWKVS